MNDEILCENVKFTKASHLKIEARDIENGGFISTQSVTALLLYEILKELRTFCRKNSFGPK